MTADNQRVKGIFAVIIASILWSTGGIFIKMVDWNPVALSGTRSLIAALVLFAYVKKPKFTKSKPQIYGAISYALTVIVFVIANKLTTAANVILLQFTAPIFVAILGVKLLKEKIHWYDIVAILVVFLGMILFFIDNVSTGNIIGNIMAVLSGLTLAFTTVYLKMQNGESAIETTLIGNMITFVVAIPFILYSLTSLSLKSIIVIVIMGVFQLGIAYIFYTYAIKHLTALEAILVTVIEPLLNPLWVFIFDGERPGSYAIYGGIIVITAVVARSIYISKLENVNRSLLNE